MSRNIAVIDLGTNTFQMMVARGNEQGYEVVSQTSTPSRLGKGGINQGILTDDALERAIRILKDFRSMLDEHGIARQDTYIFGTSAVRNAANKDVLLEKIESEMGVPVYVISGDEEAQLIYHGVKQAVPLDQNPHLIVDIGGGSVEFIIADRERVFWKQSFEVGGQRLLDRFIKTDPISPAAIRQINNYLNQELFALMNAVHQYAPATLVGSSGTFETLAEIEYWRNHNSWPPVKEIGFDVPLESFYQSRNHILSSNREERMKIPGMKELRVDMIGAAICLIDYILQHTPVRSIKASRYSLKEGAALLIFQNHFSSESYRQGL